MNLGHVTFQNGELFSARDTKAACFHLLFFFSTTFLLFLCFWLNLKNFRWNTTFGSLFSFSFITFLRIFVERFAIFFRSSRKTRMIRAVFYRMYLRVFVCVCETVFTHPPAVPHFVRVTHFRVFAATLLTLPLTLIKISIPLTPLRSYYSFSFLPLSLVFLGFLWLSFSVTHFSCGSFYGTSFFCSSVSFTLMVFVTFWSELNVFVFHSFSFLFFFLFSSRNFIRCLRRDRKSCKWVFVRIRIFQSICRSCICDWWAKSLLA